MLPVQVYLQHFNLRNLVYLLVVVMLLSALPLGYLGIYVAYLAH